MPLVTSFQVTCDGVVDEDTPLNFLLYVNNSSDALQTVTSPLFDPFTLESGSEADDYWVNVTVTITDSLNASSTIDLSVQVLNEVTTTEEPFDATSAVDATTQASDEPLYATLTISDEATTDSTAQTAASFTEVGTILQVLYLRDIDRLNAANTTHSCLSGRFFRVKRRRLLIQLSRWKCFTTQLRILTR